MSKLGTFSEYKAFLREFRDTFHTTGAVLPSGRALARAITQPLEGHTQPVRILEVGPGTGAITQEIVKHVGPGDHLDIVELNDRFVEVMKRRLEIEASFAAVADRVKVHHMAVQKLNPEQPYDHIVSGLPINNFSAGLVREVMRHMIRMLKPGGTLSFYEYIAIRKVKTLIASRNERVRLAKVGRIVNRYLKNHEFQCNHVWINFPPALAHHLRLNPKS